jgi:phosphoglycolate phosphatase
MTSLPEAVFFDWDGTLVESLKFIFSAHNHVRMHFGFPEWTFDEYKDNMKYSSVELYPKVYGANSAAAMDVLAKFMESNHLQNLVTMDGADALLDALHQANVPMGVVSNKRQAFLVREVTHLGWDKYFKAIVGAGVAARDKPEGDPLVLALSNAGLKPGPHVLYVGDTETDLLCAGAAGCKTAFLYHSQPNNPLIQKHNPEMVAKNCEELAVALFLPANQHKLIL